jgi:hypothetical protein
VAKLTLSRPTPRATSWLETSSLRNAFGGESGRTWIAGEQRILSYLRQQKVEPNLAAGGFLEFLDRLRDVSLQASITLLSSPLHNSILFARTLANFYIAIYRMQHYYGANTHNTTYLKTPFSKPPNIYNSKRPWPWP